MNPGGHKEDLGLHSHSKSQHKAQNFRFLGPLPYELEALTLGEKRGEMRNGREVREIGLPHPI
jgi:hypothetical protein